ncbi:hypothetical protein RH858_10730 [Halalkaliarchaeum sp. AArc-GB]|uniref:hypothetical protein n=1 Tax=Halalkaliarchaeum sp. AArc-GB TaxID=3074078 RepID=UPI0028616EC7|nr:hypothetical protein [Halalkaliarchaeum sp. AArc-GB]MDR5673613.1 hypothetical protein [Halalkaliarchaeum sp. AArc-GB]
MLLEDEFDISEDRALRITTLVRLLRGEGYEDVFGEYGSERHQKLQEQSGNTIEERWNNLMDELNCQSRADKGIYSSPGRNTTLMTGRIPASHDPAREPIPEIPGNTKFPQNESRYSVGISIGRIG